MMRINIFLMLEGLEGKSTNYWQFYGWIYFHQIPVYLVPRDDAWWQELKTGINNPGANHRGWSSQLLTSGIVENAKNFHWPSVAHCHRKPGPWIEWPTRVAANDVRTLELLPTSGAHAGTADLTAFGRSTQRCHVAKGWDGWCAWVETARLSSLLWENERENTVLVWDCLES